MKDKWESRFSLSKTDSEYFKDGQDKIELVRCSLGGLNCSDHRAVINKNILASRKFLLNKDYLRSIEALKEAYYMTNDLQETSCINCANLFRCMVTQSLENIYEDLHKMATGFLFRKRFQESYELARITLEEFRSDK